MNPPTQSEKLNVAYRILGVNHDATLTEVRENFKKLVLMHHPDKGGKREIFNMIKNAYNYVYIVKQNEEKEKKRQNMNLSQYLQERNMQSSMLNNNNNNFVHLPSSTSDLNNNNTFNEYFEKNKQHDAYDEGREYFLKQDTPPEKMQIAIIQEPCAFNGTFIENVRNCNGDETVSDYSTYVNRSKNKRNTSCYDIQHAYANKPILENNMPNCRDDTFLSTSAMSKLKSERNNLNVNFNNNSQQQRFNSLQNNEKQQNEKNRQYSMQKQKEIMERQFLRI